MLSTVGPIIDSQFLSDQYLPYGNEIVSVSGSHVWCGGMVEIAVQTDDVQTIVGNVHHAVSWDEQRPDRFGKPGG